MDDVSPHDSESTGGADGLQRIRRSMPVEGVEMKPVFRVAFTAAPGDDWPFAHDMWEAPTSHRFFGGDIRQILTFAEAHIPEGGAFAIALESVPPTRSTHRALTLLAASPVATDSHGEY